MKNRLTIQSFMFFIIGITFTLTAQIQHRYGRIPTTGFKPNVNYKHSGNPIDSETAYGFTAHAENFVSFPVPEGAPYTVIAPMSAPGFLSSACFGPDGTLYFTDYSTDELFIVDKSSGVITLVGSTGLGAQNGLNGITYDWSTDVFYGVNGSNLYTVDVSTGATTLVGNFGNTGGWMVDCAASCDGRLFGYDINDDYFYLIDPATGIASIVGSIGFDASFGQGMSFDYSSGNLYLSAFDGVAFAGQLRSVNLETGSTTLLISWGVEQIAPFAIDNVCGPPCPVGQATDPNPADGAIDVPIDLPQISWINGAGSTSIELFFDSVNVYSGTPITSWSLPSLEYYKTYTWQVNGSIDTCFKPGKNWKFTIMKNPLFQCDTINVYPQNVQFWTGTTDGITKTDDSEVRGFVNEDGWFMFDISSIPDGAVITQLTFVGYVDDTYWPHWSATPIPGIDPLTASASQIKNAIEENSAQGIAYIYSNESSSYGPGEHRYSMESWTITDFNVAIEDEWFAMGMDSRDNSPTYYINWDGWNQAHVPYLEVVFDHLVSVEFNMGLIIPKDFSLEQNYPNPFNPSTAISYQLPVNGFVTLKVYDVLGNEIATLVNEEKPQGKYEVDFTAKNLPSGIYFYKLQAGNFIETKKMVLMK
jgi:hypothetical protein